MSGVPPRFTCLPLFTLPSHHSLVLSDQTWLDSSLRQTCALKRFLPSWVSPLRLRKRQVMSPTAHLPTGLPSTPLTTTAAAILPILFTMTGLSLVYLSLSTVLSLLALCNRLDSRAEPLFTTTVFTHTTTSYCGFNFACIVRNFATMIMIVLASVPPSVYPPLRSNRVPGCPGGLQMAGGSQESHLTIKQTRTNVSVLPLLLTHSLSHTHSINSIYWTDFGSICSIYWWYWCCLRWFLRLLSGLLAISIHLPLPVSSGERTTLPEKFSLAEVCARSLDTREWQKKSQQHWMGSTDPTLPILCTFCPYRGFGFPCLASNWVTSCHLPLGFPFLASNCVFHCHASTGCLLGLLYVLAFCGISLLYRVFYHFVVLCCCVLRSTNLIDKNGTFKRPFSASNFDNSCRLLRHPLCLYNLQVLSLFHRAF